MTSEVGNVRVAEFVGWKAEGSGIAVGFRAADGEVSALVMSIEQAERTVPALAAAIGKAKALLNDVPGLGLSCEFAMKVDEASFGHTPGTDDVFARLRLASGGCLGFSMSKELARGLGQGLMRAANQVRVPLKAVLN